MDGWVGGGYVDEWGGAARREGWMNGACVDVGGMAGMLQSRSASSLNPMPQHWSINKEMTQQLIPSKLQQESHRPASLSSHLQTEFPSPPGRWHLPAPCSFPVVGGGEFKGHQGAGEPHTEAEQSIQLARKIWFHTEG